MQDILLRSEQGIKIQYFMEITALLDVFGDLSCTNEHFFYSVKFFGLEKGNLLLHFTNDRVAYGGSLKLAFDHRQNMAVPVK